MHDINQKLETLYTILIDGWDDLDAAIKKLIAGPINIADTNKFASLLSVLKNDDYINPLLVQISLSEDTSPWLTDFLYAVINPLDDASDSDEFDCPESLVLGNWVINFKGELSWKAANLLKFLESESAEKIQLQKLNERGDFFMTYVECLLGLLRYDRSKYLALVKDISIDHTRDEKFRQACEEILSNNYY